ncbi:hypothetical protein BDV59DRAFT_169953 [Aspergillus ambiguus]|uniref:F-box domain protein n=1 Tax=Aspergillus ambiguus TaxID=176160 RepID=UPI003CCC9BAD
MVFPQESPFEFLPNELLDEIIINLSNPPPSISRLHQPPGTRIARCDCRDLKNLARTSSRLRQVVIPRLFAHVSFDLQDVDHFLDFVHTWGLGRYVTSIVVKGRHSPNNCEDPFWWRQVLSHLHPLHITVLAPPTFIGAMMGTQIVDDHSWAFQIPLQLVQLERSIEDTHPISNPSQLDRASSLLQAGLWSSLLFNESSSLKAYNHYEYFLFQVPSLFSKWGQMASIKPRRERASLSHSLANLTSFRYTAVFPFYNHVKIVLNVVELMTNLRSLSVQLAPCENDKATELEQRGSMDPSDPWMELATGYSLIAHAVRDLGVRGRLVAFNTRDYSFDALRTELSGILGDVLDNSGWVHDNSGTWSKKPGGSAMIDSVPLPNLPPTV